MSFGDVKMSGDVILQCFVLRCKVDKNRRCALSRNSERTRAYYIIKLKPNENFQSVDVLSMPQQGPSRLLGSVQTGEYPASVACQLQA